MNSMRGIGSLRTAPDLLGKLGRDLKRLEDEPTNSDAAFDFFVTAFHLLDWTHPGDSPSAKATRKEISLSYRQMEIAGHIANGVKHLEVRLRRWDSVSDVRVRGGFWGAGFWPEGWWAKRYWATPGLIIEITASEAKYFGGQTLIDALTIARDLHAYWCRKLVPAARQPADVLFAKTTSGLPK